MSLPRHSDEQAIARRSRLAAEEGSEATSGTDEAAPQRRWPDWAVGVMRACLGLDPNTAWRTVKTPHVAWAVGSAGLLSAGALLLVQRAKLGWLKRRRKKADTSAPSTYDAVTALPTERLFLALTHQALLRARKANWRVAVVVVELAFASPDQESLRAPQCDMLYRIQAARLKSALRTTDTVARLGERSFAALIEHIVDLTAAAAVAGKLQSMVSQPCPLEGMDVTMTGRIGVAVSSTHEQDAAELLDLAVHAAAGAEAAATGSPMYAHPTGALVPMSALTDWPAL